MGDSNKLVNVKINDSITYFKKLIDLRKSCTLNKCYKVIDFEYIHGYKHLIIICDTNEKLFISLKSQNFKQTDILITAPLKSEQKFNVLKERYLSAYEKANGVKVFCLYYAIGWVYVQTSEFLSASKYRVSNFEKMTLTLESRIKEGKKEIKYNNGWNKISEIGLPEPEENVIWLRDEGESPIIASMLDSDFYGIDYFTHWRPNDFLLPLR